MRSRELLILLGQKWMQSVHILIDDKNLIEILCALTINSDYIIY